MQDDWKVTSRLTLNLGLRYEYLGIFKEEGNRLSNFIPGTGLVRVGDAGLPDLYDPDRNNFAPRLGFAYDLMGGGRTILRGGYGLYYDTPSRQPEPAERGLQQRSLRLDQRNAGRHCGQPEAG